MTMIVISYAAGQAPVVIDTRIAETYGPQLIAVEKARAGRDIEAIAPVWKQINAARGAYDTQTTANLFAAIDTRRAAEDVFTASVQAILDDGNLDNAGKLAALDALGS